MKRDLIFSLAAYAVMQCAATTADAQQHKNVRLHVNPRWEQCSFQLDPALTQAAWRRFTQEAGIVTYFRPLADARPMGARRFEVSALQWSSAIDDETSAWNDTFVHPDSMHWLKEGSSLQFPGLIVRAGLNDRVDVGAYFAKNPQANYGFLGGQVQYSLANEARRNWAAATRVSFISMFGPADLTFNVIGVDAMVSRSYVINPRWLTVSPYAGVSGYLSNSHERTAAVSLQDEHVTGALATLGAVVEISRLRLGAELNTAKVRSQSLKVGVSF